MTLYFSKALPDRKYLHYDSRALGFLLFDWIHLVIMKSCSHFLCLFFPSSQGIGVTWVNISYTWCLKVTLRAAATEQSRGQLKGHNFALHQKGFTCSILQSRQELPCFSPSVCLHLSHFLFCLLSHTVHPSASRTSITLPLSSSSYYLVCFTSVHYAFCLTISTLKKWEIIILNC